MTKNKLQEELQDGNEPVNQGTEGKTPFTDAQLSAEEPVIEQTDQEETTIEDIKTS